MGDIDPVLATEHPSPDRDRWIALGRLEASTDSLDEKQKRLQKEVDELRTELKKPRPRLERWSGALAFVALILSLLKSPAEFLDAYITRTDTQVTPERQVTLHYNPDDQFFEASIKLDVLNDGNKSERLRVADARLVPGKANSPASDDDFEFDLMASGFRNQGAGSTTPLLNQVFVDEKKPGSFVCVVQRRASRIEIEALPKRSARWCLRIKLDGRDSAVPLADGCFDLLPFDTQGILAGQPFPVTFDTSANQ